MKYAKYISETTVDEVMVRRAVFHDRVYVGDLTRVPGLPESLGYLPLEESPEPEQKDGFHTEKRYALSDGKILQTWEYVENPPPPARVFSKRKLYRALASASVWDAAKAYMENAGAWEDWQYATTLDEDDPLLMAAITALKDQLGLTDEQVESILAASIAE